MRQRTMPLTAGPTTQEEAFCQNGHRILFGWVPTRAYENDRSEFVWGGTYMAHEIYQRPDHTLGVKPPDTVWNAFTGRRRLDPCGLCGISSQTSTVLVRETSQHYSFEADLTFSQGTRNFGLQLYRDETSGRCYQYTFSVLENHFQFDKVPNWPLACHCKWRFKEAYFSSIREYLPYTVDCG